MQLFIRRQNKLEKAKEASFGNEKDIQSIIEKNLAEVFGLELVKSEVAVGNLRIDSLAFDNQNKCFVIIEYKKDRNFSVIDQGYAYLALLLNNKADFILEYNESKDKSIDKKNTDWSQSRIIFVSPEFTKYQRQAINFKNLPIELWEIKKFSNDLIIFDQLESSQTSESISKISPRSEALQKVTKEIKVYTAEDHLEKASDKIKQIYEELVERIQNLDPEIKINPQKYYISFKKNKNFAYLTLRKTKLRIILILPIDVGKNIIKKHDVLPLSKSVQKFYGSECFEVSIDSNENLDEIIQSVEKAYRAQL